MSDEGKDTAFDLVGAVTGIREWSAYTLDYQGRHHPGLFSRGIGEFLWKPGVNEAACMLRPSRRWTYRPKYPHTVPHPKCYCGFYAWHPTAKENGITRKTRSYTVPGVIRAWGNIEVHHHGFRAQYAEVVALLKPARFPRNKSKLVERLAREYDVPLLNRADLVSLANERQVPRALRPEAPKVADNPYARLLPPPGPPWRIPQPYNWQVHGGHAYTWTTTHTGGTHDPTWKVKDDTSSGTDEDDPPSTTPPFYRPSV